MREREIDAEWGEKSGGGKQRQWIKGQRPGPLCGGWGGGRRGEGRGPGGGIAGRALGRCEPHGSPGRRQTLGGDVTPELETMINMIICIKSEWVLFSGRMPRMMNGSGSQIDG